MVRRDAKIADENPSIFLFISLYGKIYMHIRILCMYVKFLVLKMQYLQEMSQILATGWTKIVDPRGISDDRRLCISSGEFGCSWENLWDFALYGTGINRLE